MSKNVNSEFDKKHLFGKWESKMKQLYSLQYNCFIPLYLLQLLHFEERPSPFNRKPVSQLEPCPMLRHVTTTSLL